jgi:hypothetical protein
VRTVWFSRSSRAAEQTLAPVAAAKTVWQLDSDEAPSEPAALLGTLRRWTVIAASLYRTLTYAEELEAAGAEASATATLAFVQHFLNWPLRHSLMDRPGLKDGADAQLAAGAWADLWSQLDRSAFSPVDRPAHFCSIGLCGAPAPPIPCA